MKSKRFGKILVGIFGSLFIVILIIAFSVDYLVKQGIESIGTDMTQTGVTVENVSISLFTGSGTIEGIRIKNPEGFNNDNAFEIGEVTVELDIISLLSDKIKVEEVIIRNSLINIEQKLPQNNLKVLMDNIEASAESESTTETSLLIEYLLIEESTVNFSSDVGGERSAKVSISKIEQRNVGENNRKSVGIVMKSIIDTLALRAIKQVTGSNLKEKAKDLLKGIVN